VPEVTPRFITLAAATPSTISRPTDSTSTSRRRQATVTQDYKPRASPGAGQGPARLDQGGALHRRRGLHLDVVPFDVPGRAASCHENYHAFAMTSKAHPARDPASEHVPSRSRCRGDRRRREELKRRPPFSVVACTVSPLSTSRRCRPVHRPGARRHPDRHLADAAHRRHRPRHGPRTCLMSLVEFLSGVVLFQGSRRPAARSSIARPRGARHALGNGRCGKPGDPAVSI